VKSSSFSVSFETMHWYEHTWMQGQRTDQSLELLQPECHQHGAIGCRHDSRDQVGSWRACLVCGVAGLEAVQGCFAGRIRDARQDLRPALADHVHQRGQILHARSAARLSSASQEACKRRGLRNH